MSDEREKSSSLRRDAGGPFDIADDGRTPEVALMWKRIDSFSTMEDGWCSGAGSAPSGHARAYAGMVLAHLIMEHPEVERPKLFPTPDGHIQAEWVVGPWAADVSFDAEGTIHAAATHSRTMEPREVRFENGRVTAEDATGLAKWLGSLVADGSEHE